MEKYYIIKDRYVYCFHGTYVSMLYVATMQSMYEHIYILYIYIYIAMGSRHDNS